MDGSSNNFADGQRHLAFWVQTKTRLDIIFNDFIYLGGGEARTEINRQVHVLYLSICYTTCVSGGAMTVWPM